MQDRVTYEFAVIRVVPKVEREEFLNIGVILFSKRKKFLDMRYRLDEDRLTSFSPEVDVEQVRGYLQAWEQVCRGGDEGGPIGLQEQGYRFRWLTAYKSTIIQSSRVHPGLCADPAAMLEKLFDFYVL